MAETKDSNNQVRFMYGTKDRIAAGIESTAIDGSDLVITSDTDELVFIDPKEKTQKPLRSRSKEAHTVKLGGGSIGALKEGETIPAGIDIDELILKLTQKRVPYSYQQPGVTCKVSTGSAAGTYEIGTSITTTIAGQVTPNDAGAVTETALFKDGTQIATISSDSISEAQTFTITSADIKFTAKGTYEQGPIKNDNLGDASPSGRIEAGTKESSAVTFKGARNAFYGCHVEDLPEAITSDYIRALKYKKFQPANGNQVELVLKKGEKNFVVATPTTTGGVDKIFYVQGNDPDMVNNCTHITVSVEGANKAEPISYDVYTYQMSTPATADMTFKITL